MKIISYGIILLLVWMLPIRGTDVGKLIPVEVLAVSQTAGTTVVRTDTGDEGKGAALDEAFVNLKETAPGIIYLDTAEYLLLEPGMEQHLSALGGYLKDGIKVCNANEEISLDGIADFLSAHEPGVKLEAAAKGEKMQIITEENGRFEIK